MMRTFLLIICKTAQFYQPSSLSLLGIALATDTCTTLT